MKTSTAEATVGLLSWDRTLVDERSEQLFSSTVVDDSGASVGLVEAAWLAPESDRLEFVGVKAHWLSRKVHVIPAAGMGFDGHQLQARVPFSLKQIEAAPRRHVHAVLTSADRDTIESTFSYSATKQLRAS